MANEIKINQTIIYANGTLKQTINPGQISIDQTAKGKFAATLSIGTSEEDIAFTDITTLGVLWMQNHDAANYVQWGAKDTTMKTIGRIEAGETAGPFRMEPGVTLRMVANTAACLVEFWLAEN